uniref:BlaI/MecI/CopY family transcriptional regulator n=1 Tax=Acetatifactor sp. TaxID=1872090 RepID=UPI004055B70B
MNSRELDVLNILWKAEEPMMATNIVEQKKELTQSTVTAVLRKLLKDGLVEVAGVTHSGRVLSRTYRPTEKSRQVIKEYFLELYEGFRDVITPEEMCEAIMNE